MIPNMDFLNYSINTLQEQENQKKDKKMINLDFIGDVATTVQNFNPKYLETQVAVANANARVAEAQSNQNTPRHRNNLLYIGVGVAVLIVLILFLKK